MLIYIDDSHAFIYTVVFKLAHIHMLKVRPMDNC